jgi:hypothetical protein
MGALKPTVNELARQHFHLSGPLSPIAQLLCSDSWIFLILLINVLVDVPSFRPEHASILRFAFGGGSAPREE